MTDLEFFDYYCNCAKITYNSGDKEIIFIKNKNFEIIYISPGYVEAFPERRLYTLNEHKIPEEKIAVYELQTITAEKQDEQIRATKQPKDFIFIDDHYHIRHIHKRPIINPVTGNFVGLLGYVSNYTHPNLLKLIYKINGITIGLANKIPKQSLKYELNEKQNMVLFLYLNKYSNTEISEILTILGHKISKTRVNDHLENLKFIFHVKTKEQLIEKGISLGYHLLIPRKLLKFGSYELDEEIIISG